MSVHPELDQWQRDIDRLKREMRDVRSQIARALIGGGVRQSALGGTPPSSIGSPIGAETLWTNNSGGALTRGAVVVRDGNRLIDVTATASNEDVVGVVAADAASAAETRVLHLGYHSAVLVTGAVAAGDFLATSTTSSRAASIGTLAVPGVFAIALSAAAGPGSGTVAAFVFPVLRFTLDENGISITMGDGTNTVSTGELTWFEVPYDLTVTGWTLTGDAVGSIQLDLWKDSYANFPPTVADTVTGSEKPLLSSARTNQDLALTTWTVDWDQGQWVLVNVDSASGIKKATLSLRTRKR